MKRWLHSLFVALYMVALAVGGISAEQPAPAYASQLCTQDQGQGAHQHPAQDQGDTCCTYACYNVFTLRPTSQRGMAFLIGGTIGYQPASAELIGRNIRPDPAPPRQIYSS